MFLIDSLSAFLIFLSCKIYTTTYHLYIIYTVQSYWMLWEINIWNSAEPGSFSYYTGKLHLSVLFSFPSQSGIELMALTLRQGQNEERQKRQQQTQALKVNNNRNGLYVYFKNILFKKHFVNFAPFKIHVQRTQQQQHQQNLNKAL